MLHHGAGRVRFESFDGNTTYVHYSFIVAEVALKDNQPNLGLLRVDRPLTDAIPCCNPAIIQTETEINVGEPIGCIGYPREKLVLNLADSGPVRLCRFGPLLQQGFISALAPTGRSEQVDRILLDLRTTRTMQGAPIFLADSGTIVGIHDEAEHCVVAFAEPMSAEIASTLIAHLPRSKNQHVETEFPRPRVKRPLHRESTSSGGAASADKELSRLEVISRGVCAVGLRGPKPEIEGGLSDFTIYGTGFLIDELHVLTNRHVGQALEGATADPGKQNHFPSLHFELHEGDNIRFINVPVEDRVFIETGGPDLCLMRMSVSISAKHPSFMPLEIQTMSSVGVGSPIATLGYPLGAELLRSESRGGSGVYRYGPVLQQGFVSAIAPFDGVEGVRRYLLDIRTANGMSGSPVFCPISGTVVGIHEAGMDCVTAFAIPISSEMTASMVNYMNGSRGGAGGPKQMYWSVRADPQSIAQGGR